MMITAISFELNQAVGDLLDHADPNSLGRFVQQQQFLISQ
ncbi:hypothetical protein ACVWZ6_002497 [Bradyrhizobium sp. GM6.1]